MSQCRVLGQPTSPCLLRMRSCERIGQVRLVRVFGAVFIHIVFDQ